MKICENCGREYGDSNPFCPFCDERYGVVILENDVISAKGLPPYVEEFPVIGEMGVKQESFAENRDKIYKRNIRLVARENFLPKMEARAAYKPVMPLAEVYRDGKIAPYVPPNPIVEKFKNICKKIKSIKLSKTGKSVLGVLSVAAVFLVVVGFSWFETTDTYADYQYEKSWKESEKEFVKQQSAYAKAIAEYHNTNVEAYCIYGKNNAVMHLIDNYNSDYDFAYINDTGKNLSLADFSELFSCAEGMEDFKLMQIYYPSGAEGRINIFDGVLDIENEDFSLSIGLEYNEKNIERNHLIKSGEAVTGYLVEKKNVPEEIIITSDSGLELKLTDCRESRAVDNVFRYDFEFKNTSGKDMLYFWNEFAGAEYTDRIYNFTVNYPNGENAYIRWNNGSCTGYFYHAVDEHGEVVHVPPYVYSGNTVTGFIELNFRY